MDSRGGPIERLIDILDDDTDKANDREAKVAAPFQSRWEAKYWDELMLRLRAEAEARVAMQMQKGTV